MSTQALTGQQVAEAGLEGWAFLLSYGLHGLQTRIHTKDFAAGVEMVGAIGKAAAELDHKADLDLRETRVEVRLHSGYDVGVSPRSTYGCSSPPAATNLGNAGTSTSGSTRHRSSLASTRRWQPVEH